MAFAATEIAALSASLSQGTSVLPGFGTSGAAEAAWPNVEGPHDELGQSWCAPYFLSHS